MTAFIALVFVLAGIVKGVIGMGLPTVAVALLSMVMAPQEAAAILLVPSFVTNVVQLLAGPRLSHLLRRFAPLVLGIFAGTWGAALLGIGQSASIGTFILGAALVTYAVLGLRNMTFSLGGRAERALSIPAGALTGVITAATGVFVLPAVPFLQALGLEKDDLVQALGICFTASTIALGLALAGTGSLQVATGALSMLAVIPAVAGMWLGQLLRQRISAALFRRWFFTGLLVIGVTFLGKFLLG
ncbi:sulfite exporter TauE/SafE family protein [Noviherbaspirillum sp.]|uniref:sulfite exporter TauE/SafE family protein n=1 Tax=Noviherbaspirillum sp. TaxID=1926288 RepID=UPI002D364DD6|nr:sulfite exporter TauE/SafE family protein [Noviherbaspirillum sp.]HZW23245.1 sulfite exporter TauE/SafE family protein [Noviherbaspirillum sp.]